MGANTYFPKYSEKVKRIIISAFNCLDSPKIIVDTEGIILYVSKYHLEYLGYDSEDELIGHKVDDVIPGTRMSMVLKTLTPEYGYLFHFIHRITGEITTVICNRYPVYENGKLLGVLCETTFPDGVSSIPELSNAVQKLKSRKKEMRTDALQTQIANLILGVSPTIVNLRNLIAQIAAFNFPVLITGETGSGKEVFANALHQLSPFAKENFVKINCAAIPGELLESELFGYEKGAFSGALREGKIGKFEYAQNGSVLLDEIGDMPMGLQSKLLRVLQEKEFEKIGSVKTQPFNARIICTTNCNINQLIEEKKFRQDLYYRINVIELHIPPLRERKEDIPILSNSFIHRVNNEYGLSITGISREGFQKLRDYDWPGNVRELRHVIEHACVMQRTGILQPYYILPDIHETLIESAHQKANVLSDTRRDEVIPLEEARKLAEIEQIQRALRTADGNKTLAAKYLQIDRTVLYDKIKRYKISI